MKERRNIELLARGVCVRNGRLLVCHSLGAENVFLPGGHVEFGESAPVALAREIEEELGRPARVGCFLGAVEHTFRQRGRRHCEVNLCFALRIAGLGPGRVPPSCESSLDFQWLPLGALPSSRLEPWPLRTRLRAWLRGRGTAAAWGSTFRARR